MAVGEGRGLETWSVVWGAGPGLGGPRLRQVRRGGVDKVRPRGTGTCDGPVPEVHNGAGEGLGATEGGPRGRRRGSGCSGTSLPWVPAPVTWAPDPAAAVRPLLGRSVSGSVGQWPAARLSTLMFGSGRDPGAVRSPEPPGEEPFTQVSGLFHGSQARCAVRSGSARRGIAWDTESPQILEPPGEERSVTV